MTKIFNFVVKIVDIDIFITFFFLFSVAPFISFINISFFLCLVDFFYFFKIFLVFYLLLFFFFIIVVDIRQFFFNKKNELNQLYLKYIYTCYVAFTTNYAFFSVLYTQFFFFLKISIKSVFLNIYFVFIYFFHVFLSYFLFWKPITKRISYFGLFRISRAKWLYSSVTELNRFKY